MDAGAQNEEPTFDEALVMELLSRAAAEAGGQRAAANIKLTAGAAKTCGELAAALRPRGAGPRRGRGAVAKATRRSGRSTSRRRSRSCWRTSRRPSVVRWPKNVAVYAFTVLRPEEACAEAASGSETLAKQSSKAKKRHIGAPKIPNNSRRAAKNSRTSLPTNW